MRLTRANGRVSRLARCLAHVAVVVLAFCGTATVAAIGAIPAMAAGSCNVMPGGPYTGQPWQQSRLNFRSVWGITRGAGVVVAVLDSGLDANVAAKSAPVHIQMNVLPGANVIPAMTGQAVPTGTADCYKHGTEVASIIAAQKTDSAFVGVAPDATILPIKMTDGQSGTSQATLAAAIRTAVNDKVQIINISSAADGERQNMGVLESAVNYADLHHVVIVASAGNDGSTSNQPGFPAAFSPYYSNVIAVSATDSNDAVAGFSESGSYVTVAAPGVDVWVPSANEYLKESGTSYAAPYVSGTVALMLSAVPGLRNRPDLVRNRLIATADPPAVQTPDPHYGYGVVDPYLAVTSVRNDVPAPTSAPALSAVAGPRAPTSQNRTLQHIALGVGLSLLGLAVLVAVGAGVYRAANRSRTAARTPV